MSLLNIISEQSALAELEIPTEPPVDPPGTTYYAPVGEDEIAFDNGEYNGFSFVDQNSDGSIGNIHKKSPSHADAGPLMVGRSTSGGVEGSWIHNQAFVTGHGLITCAALTYCVYKEGPYAGRQIIGWQDGTATWVKFAYRDGPTGNFTFIQQVNAPAGFTINFSPVKTKVMPWGEVWCGVYYWPYDAVGDPHKIGFLKSTAGGLSWSVGVEIFAHYTQNPAPPATDWRGHEFDWVVTHDTGVQATTKIISACRVNMTDEGGTWYIFRKSSDGGATWGADYVTEDPGSYVDDNGNLVGGPFGRSYIYLFLPSNAPPCLCMHNGQVVFLMGERNTANGYKLKYATATPDGAFENKWDNWERPITKKTFNCTTLGSSIDCGYPDWFQAKATAGGPLKLYSHYYDVSLLPKDPMITEDRCYIGQIKIID